MVVQQYGSIMEYNGMTLAARNTFLIDPNGIIRKVYIKCQAARSQRRSVGRSCTVAVREVREGRQEDSRHKISNQVALCPIISTAKW